MKNSIPSQSSGTESIRRSPASRTPQSADRPRALRLGRRGALPLVLLCAVLLARPCGATPGQWDFTGSLNTARYEHSATLLPNGQVLVAGGFGPSGAVSSAELYDPATGTWTATGNLNIGRSDASATLLSNGFVLLAGGANAAGDPEPTAELYDPATGTWSFTGNLKIARHSQAATLLPNGKVLVAAGYGGPGTPFLRSAELYDPATGTWTLTGSLTTGRANSVSQVSSTLLPNGKVLVEGGVGARVQILASAEVYDPATGTWSVTGSLNTARAEHSATLLPEGKVLVAGGEDLDFSTLATAELYDPVTGNWTPTGSLLAAHTQHTATLLPNGMVLLAAGSSFDDLTTDAELYDPSSGTWSVTGPLNTARVDHTATLLPGGMVLVAAGLGDGGTTILNSAELYDPGINLATQVSGRGTIAGQGGTDTFHIRATETAGRPSGSVTFSDPAAGVAISRARVRTLTFAGNSAALGGTARMGDGTRVTYTVSVTDNSSDGSSDTFNISLSNGYSAGGTLMSGDIQIQ